MLVIIGFDLQNCTKMVININRTHHVVIGWMIGFRSTRVPHPGPDDPLGSAEEGFRKPKKSSRIGFKMSQDSKLVEKLQESLLNNILNDFVQINEIYHFFWFQI